MQDETLEKGATAAKGAQTLMRALDILDEIIEGPAKVTDLAQKLSLSRATTYRLAQALRSRDYLSPTRDGYSLGPKLLQLGSLALEQTDFLRIARTHMEQLSEQTGFCVFIGKREGDWSRHLDRVTGRQRLRVSTAPGDRRFITETGLGKALLLDEDSSSLTRLFYQGKPNASEAQLKAFLSAMEVHSGRQLVMHESELDDGVRSVASPVRNAKGQIIMAISIASAAHYLTDEVTAEIAGPVRSTAINLSAAFGYARPE